MRTYLATRMTPVALTLLGFSSLAAAQDAASAATPTATTDPAVASAPAATTDPAPTSVTMAPASAPEVAAPPAAAEEAKPVPSYFRFDHDYMFGLQLWAGATYPLTDSLGLATDIYVAENYPYVSGGADAPTAVQSWWGEFDIGPALTLGPVTLTPMAGIAFDWAAKRAVALNAPQLYTVVSLDKFYFESWIWTVLYSPFKDPVYNNYFHTRNWALYKINSTIGVGPQFEFTYLLNDTVLPKGTSAMPLGAHVELSYGTGNSLGLFLGYELDKDVRDSVGGKGAEGRLTFVHNF
jgi:hypothetical protein